AVHLKAAPSNLTRRSSPIRFTNKVATRTKWMMRMVGTMVNINYCFKLLFPPSIWDCILQDIDERFCCFIESDPHAQALLQHAVEHESLKTLEGAIDYNDDSARVAHEGVGVKEFTQVLEPGQLSEDKYDEGE